MVRRWVAIMTWAKPLSVGSRNSEKEKRSDNKTSIIKINLTDNVMFLVSK
jgi:hypothetical protein